MPKDLKLSKNEFKAKYDNFFIDYKDILDKCLKNKLPLSQPASQIPLEKLQEMQIPSSHFLPNECGRYLSQ